MAKRKNPLKDLDAFLKQEAKNFVDPTSINPTENSETPKTQSGADDVVSEKMVLDYLANLKNSDVKAFYNLLKKSVELSGREASDNKMLINTFLYLQNKGNWKESIKDYWSSM